MTQKSESEPWLMYVIVGGALWCLVAGFIWSGLGSHYGALFVVGSAVVIFAAIVIRLLSRTG